MNKDNTALIQPNTIISPIEKELTSSYMEYAMSVITARALPDIRDGLKLVQRRILYAMYTLGNFHSKPAKKSARVAGDVVGKYHPHGTDAVYEAIVRMGQDFATRYPLVEGQGNFGSLDGDSPAAMRYTGVRLSKLGELMLDDLKYNTVNYEANYDDTERIPSILPARIPHLLMCGTSGIAVGMATNIPPHNLGEIIDALIYKLHNPNATSADLACFIKAPDFPGGGIICNASEMKQIYETGRGSVIIRSTVEIDEKRGIIKISDIPYMVSKSDLVQQMAQLVNDRLIEGIVDIVDDSVQGNVEINILLNKQANAHVILNKLFKQSKLQTFFHVNMVALNKGTPQLCNIANIIEGFIDHRMSVVSRKAQFLLKRYKDRLSHLQGLATTVANIEEIVKNVKKQSSTSEAQRYLLENTFPTFNLDPFFKRLPSMIDDPIFQRINENNHSRYKYRYMYTAEQAHAVMEIRINALTHLEQSKMVIEAHKLLEAITRNSLIINNRDERIRLILEELQNIKDSHADERRTQIADLRISLNELDFVEDEEVIVSYSQSGYIKTQKLSEYRTQNRGGTGKIATTFKIDDLLLGAFVTSKRSTLMCFTATGRVYSLECYHIPEYDRTAKGRPIFTLIDSTEKITTIIPHQDREDISILVVTKRGIVNSTSIRGFSNIKRKNGLIAISLRDDDEVLRVLSMNQDDHIMIFSSSGRAVRFRANSIRDTSRGTIGVIGMKLKPQEEIVSATTFNPNVSDMYILSVTENGLGKLTSIDSYPTVNRNRAGVLTLSRSKRLVDSTIVSLLDELMLFTNDGNTTRISIEQIRITGRIAAGVKLMQLRGEAKVIKVEKIERNRNE
jgi:DNA gyrase subunit A